MKTTLTIEESARLIELGVGPKLASYGVSNFYNGISSEELMICYLFNLTDILSILPKEIKIHRDGDTLSMIYHCGQWSVGYTNCAVWCDHTKTAPELIDALNSLLIWAITNGHLKIDKK